MLYLKALASLYNSKNHNRLESSVLGIKFSSPFGIAAGFDKNAHIVPTLSNLGFGFLELGSVTNLASSGNEKPRMFRLQEDQALINRLGLNNNGPAEFVKNLEKLNTEIPLAINIAKTHSEQILGDAAIEDMVSCYSKVAHKGSFTVLNISCPNTKEGKTFEDAESLEKLLSQLDKVRISDKPLLVKFSSDTEDTIFLELLNIIESHQINGLVLSNTSANRVNLNSPADLVSKIGRGGLSGPPVFAQSLHKVRVAYQALSGRLPIIGLGGINSAEAAYSYLKAGASLLELYTALVYQGPGLISRLNSGLDKLLEADGFSNMTEAIGCESKLSNNQAEELKQNGN